MIILKFYLESIFFETVSMSLSPLPESVTTMDSDFGLFFASLITSAIACADSKAGIIPSVLVSNKNASITSLSVAL